MNHLQRVAHVCLAESPKITGPQHDRLCTAIAKCAESVHSLGISHLEVDDIVRTFKGCLVSIVYHGREIAHEPA